ncbi:hypothetical protein MBLNU230_g5299t1 [Neophaeotheca triangularis]
MASKVVPITSPAHLKTLTTSNTYTIIDFYADWCGPCKQISPVFNTLASSSKPGKLAFCKVNVDDQREIASTYGISAMPTFLVLKGSSVVETVRGANVAALRAAVAGAEARAAKEGAAVFESKGRTLGGEGVSSGAGRGSGGVGAGFGLGGLDVGGLLASPAGFAQRAGWVAKLVRFVGLYFTTLLAFDPAGAAEGSPFAVKRR